MNESPALPSALGIEAVEWLTEGGENLTVRIRGRWRRGRPTWSGQPLLVIEAAGGRHRFPAMPEPPSLTGAAPGTWQMTFSVPVTLAPTRGSHAWLQLGGAVIVPLPVPVPAAASRSEGSNVGEIAGRAPPSHAPALGEPVAEPPGRLRAAELAAESARRRADEAGAAVTEMTSEIERLEAELERLRSEPARLNALLLDRERQLRAAHQRAHAEHAARLELAGGQRETERAAAERAAHELRVAELEEEIETVRRAADEAGHLAEAAQAARVQAERRVAAVRDRGAPDTGLLRDRGAPDTALLRERAARAALVATLAELRVELDRLRVDAERERAARIRAEAEAADLRRNLAEQSDRSARAWEAIARVRSELGSLRNGHGEESAAPVADVVAAPIGGAGGATAPPDPGTDASVEPERFAEALARLRAATPSPHERQDPETPAAEPETSAAEPETSAAEPAEAAAAGPDASAAELAEPSAPSAPSERRWLEQALQDLARVDRPSAERLLAALAPELDLDRSKLIKRMAAGPIRRALARLRRRPPIPPELQDVLRSPGSLAELELEPQSALWLIAVMIDRTQMTGERTQARESFTIAYRRPAALDPALYLQVWERYPSVVRDTAPSGQIAATVVCPPASLARVLADGPADGASVLGDERPLQLVRTWIERAQSG